MPPDKPWKAFERRVAKAVGGKRRGPNFTDGRDDVIHPLFSIECKLLSRVVLGRFFSGR